MAPDGASVVVMAYSMTRFHRHREPLMAWHHFSLLFTFLLAIIILLALVLLPPAAH
jgi:hypothetical protein